MSVAYFEWPRLLRRSRLSKTARLVGFVIATYLNAAGECWPSVATIAKGAGVSESTVHRAIRELRRSGYLWVTFRRQETSIYRAKRPEWLPANEEKSPNEDPYPF
jgi:DNA-binding transcriptional regulator YhcF (GntR family)